MAGKKASLVSVGEKEWTVSTEAGVVLGVFPARGDVYALARRIPGLVISRTQSYRFIEPEK